MKTESSIKENLISTTTPPITDIDWIITAICEWNWITAQQFKDKIWNYYLLWTESNGRQIYVNDTHTIINPIGMFLTHTYQWRTVVFEKDNDKFFWKIKVSSSGDTRYQLGEKIIQIPFQIRAENEDTGEWITIFPKMSDFIQPRMKSFYVVNTGWAERQRLEKEIMAKLIELAQVRGWNEIISTQNVVEWLKETLKKRGIDLILDETITLCFPWRKIRDTAGQDSEYLAPPIEVSINFDSRYIQSKWYSCHWFGTPTSWWNPCWWNRDNDIRECLRNCDLKWLINLIISWAYGYNSADTGRTHDDRHPLWKLRDYIWYVYDHQNEIWMQIASWLVENYNEIKAELEINGWLDNNSWVKEFLSKFEKKDEDVW